MSRPRLLLLSSLLLLGGCLWPVREETDRAVHDLATHPYDVAPAESVPVMPSANDKGAQSSGADKKSTAAAEAAPTSATDLQTVAFIQGGRPDQPAESLPKYDLKIPTDIPGSEAPPIDFSKLTPEQKQRAIQKLYPELPPLPIAPTPMPGPNGQPYTLADLQKLAAENSAPLRQAVLDVKAAEGALIQAKTYQNPTIAYSASPTNNNSNAGAQGGYIQQHLTMWGKRPLAVAAAQKNLENTELALRRARSDLSTNVRNAYFGLIVAVETVRVNRALARFTDEIYRLYTGYLAGGFAASYEPAALFAQAASTRMAYEQSIKSYAGAWKQLVATIGLKQLPLTEVAGQVDRLIPYYDYDTVLEHVLRRHTDVLTARNGVEIARYNLKLAQITPYPDMDVQASVWKESTIAPYQIFYAAQVAMPIPIWDQNKGNTRSAQAALSRAIEESHRVDNALTNTLAAAYFGSQGSPGYQQNLIALEKYRRDILPNQVRYYRGVFDRRQIDINASPSDLVTAQQSLAGSVSTYLGILGSLWSSVVSVADLLQTDDLFQTAQPHKLPEMPALDDLPRWLCPHNRLAGEPVGGVGTGCSPKWGWQPAGPAGKSARTPSSGSAPTMLPPSEPVLPSPRRVDTPSPSQTNQTPALQPPPAKSSQAPALQPPPLETAGVVPFPQRSRLPERPSEPVPANLTEQLLEPPPEIHKQPGVSGRD